MKNKVELLAPIGSYTTLQAAIKAGADAVYFGITHLNMRCASTAGKFDLEDLEKISKICHKSNVRCYLTLHTIVYDS